jgi:hypothetical protein
MTVLKVYGGLKHMGRRGQLRTIVATTSKTKAAALVGIRPGEMARYWCVTSNKIEVETAMAAPGQVFQASDYIKKDFLPVDLLRGAATERGEKPADTAQGVA